MLRRCLPWFGIACLLIAPVALLTQPASAQQRNSRLSGLIRQTPNLFLPGRLVLGTENAFTLQAPAGSQVQLFVSPSGEGASAPNGLSLRVGTDAQRLEGVVPEKGVLTLSFPVPDEAELEGKAVFVDAIVWKQADYSDLQQATLVDSTGRRTTSNQLSIAKAVELGKGPRLLPNMPGLPGGLLQQVNTLSEIQNGDSRKRELLEDFADRSPEVLMDQNSFINRGITPLGR